MIKMSFYDGTWNDKIAKELIENTDKEIRWTYGFKYRNPTTLNKPISKEKALELIRDFADLDEYEDFIHINTFSDNDLW